MNIPKTVPGPFIQPRPKFPQPIHLMLEKACRSLLLGLSLAAMAAAQSPNLVHAWVDPLRGNNATGQVGVSTLPFRTLQAGANALQVALAAPSARGVLHAATGRYGFGSGLSGDIWPVVVPARVSVLGANALSTIIDGAAVDPSAPAFLLPSTAGRPELARPCFVFEDASGFDDSLLTRLTFVAADRAVLVIGGGQVSPTFSFCAFIGCTVAVHIHSQPGAGGGVHRLKLLACTLGANQTGLLVTAADASGALTIPVAAPAVVNCLLRNTSDFEGVSASSVLACGFDPATSNQAPGVVQAPVPAVTSIFVPQNFSLEDLFVGAFTYPTSAPPANRWFSDWRLNWRLPSSGLPNPGIGAGTQTFPATVGNGTIVAIALPAESTGSRGCGGPQDPGPVFGPPGWSLGYDTGASFHVGGTMPLSDGFGTTGQGLPFDVMHLIHREPSYSRFLFGAFASAGPEYPLGSEVPIGMLATPLLIAGMEGGFWLDVAAPQFMDLSAFIQGPGTGMLGGSSRWLIEFAPPVANVRIGLNLQIAFTDYRGIAVLSNAQHVSFEI